eukprot:2445048-Rhodomonas_salina.1
MSGTEVQSSTDIAYLPTHELSTDQGYGVPGVPCTMEPSCYGRKQACTSRFASVLRHLRY